MKDIQPLIVKSDWKVRQALERLNDTCQGILLLIDEAGRLFRTVTDGDIRRLLLSGLTLDDTLGCLPSQEPKVVELNAIETDVLQLMNTLRINHMPIVDRSGQPIGIMLRHEIDSRILLSTPHLGDFEMDFVEEAFRTNWIAPLGPNVDEFEREIAGYVGVAQAAALSSGTAALHLALRILGVDKGDSVFCSTLTFVASANPILYLGATPVFIDSEPETWNMSPRVLAEALAEAAVRGQLPKAVIVVSLYGQSADMDPLIDLCSNYNIPVIEDAAESLGATYKGRASGTMGKIGIFSFNGNKIITTSGGGMLVSHDPVLVEKARFLSTQARESTPWYEHAELGYNYRMSNVLAGIGRGQLKVLDQRVEARREIFERYKAELHHIKAIRWMPEALFGRSTRWLSVCMIDQEISGLSPSEVIGRLAARGIEARHVWRPMHQQPLFKGCSYYPHEPGASFADQVFEAGICLPSGSNMPSEQQDRVIESMDLIFSAKHNWA
jgi:dTDP-4-amino-4,6-dideoxygalactose transaminase